MIRGGAAPLVNLALNVAMPALLLPAGPSTTGRRRCARPASRSAALSSSSSGPLQVVIAGAPASGKGTQCELIVAKYGLAHVSTGDLLRAEVAAGTDAGRAARSFMDRGDLVPDEVVCTMVKRRLAEKDAQEKGWLLDGAWRTEPRRRGAADARQLTRPSQATRAARGRARRSRARASGRNSSFCWRFARGGARLAQLRADVRRAGA